jgi:hypothetical protein
MRCYEATSAIAASPQAVWAVLSDGASWPSWDSGVDAVEGVRTYEVSEEADGQVTFRMREQYSGPLLPLIWRSMPDLGPSFQCFARGLKQRVESAADRDG